MKFSAEHVLDINHMRYIVKNIVILFMLLIGLVHEIYASDGSSNLTGVKHRLGYALGQDMGSSLRRMNPDIDLESLFQGLRDAYDGKESAIPIEEATRLKREFASKRHEEKQALQQKLAEKNLMEGATFLEKNKSDPQVKTTLNGLQYIVMKEGSGKFPSSEDQVVIRTRGTLLSGAEFENTSNRKDEGVYVKSLVPGLAEGVQLMREGGRSRLFVPARLGYGFEGFGQFVGPFSLLIYDVELVSVNKKTGKSMYSTDTPPKGVPAQSSALPQGVEGIPGTLLPPKNQSEAHGSTLSLSAIEQAAYTVYQAFTAKLHPGSSDEEIAKSCDVLASAEFAPSCRKIFIDRREHLKQEKIMQANFDKPKLKSVDEKKKAVTVQWEERFQKGEKEISVFQMEMEVLFDKVGADWKAKKMNFVPSTH